MSAARSLTKWRTLALSNCWRVPCHCTLPNSRTDMTEGLDDLLVDYRYAASDSPRAMGEAKDAAPPVVFLASPPELSGLVLRLGGDRLSMWEPAWQVAWALRETGWTARDLDNDLPFLLRGDPAGGSRFSAVDPQATTSH